MTKSALTCLGFNPSIIYDNMAYKLDFVVQITIWNTPTPQGGFPQECVCVCVALSLVVFKYKHKCVCLSPRVVKCRVTTGVDDYERNASGLSVYLI